MGRIIPNIWTNKKCSKAPTSSFNGTYQKLVGGFNHLEKYYGLLRFMRRHGGSERPPHPSELRTLRVIADKVKPRQNLYEMPAGAPLIQKHEHQP